MGDKGEMPKSSEQTIALIRKQPSPLAPLPQGEGKNTGASLLRWRAWYADDEQQGGEGQNQDGGYNPATLEDAQKIIAALQKRVGERDAQIGQLRQSNSGLDERLKAIEDAQKQRLEKQGDFEELARQRAAEIETLKPTAERAKALEGVIRESNEARIKRVPETMRSIVPADYPPEKLQAWLNANEALLTKPPPPNFDAGAGNGSGGSGTKNQIKVTDADKQQAEIAGSQGFKITAEDIAKRREAMKAENPDSAN